MVSLAGVAVLSAVAVAMVAATGGLLKWGALARTRLRAIAVLFLLLMMTGMLLGAALYFVAPSTTGLVEGLWVASGVMSASVLLVFFEFLREARASQIGGISYAPAPIARQRMFGAAVLATVIVNEFLMGWTFQRAAGGPVWIGGGGVPRLVELVLVSPWFVFPMALEMALTLAMLSRQFPRHVRWLLAVQPIAMVASPPTIPGVDWAIWTAAIASAVMAGALAYVLRLLYRGEKVGSATLSYAIRLFTALSVMAGGLAWWALDGELALFALGVLLQMVVFLDAIVSPRQFAAELPVRDETVPSPDSAAAPTGP